MAKPPMPQETVDRVHARSGYRCEGCGGDGHHLHHRKLRSQMGGHEVSNILVLCTTCHARAHAHPALARERGWILKSTRDPLQEPALLHTRRGRRWGMLDNEGGITWTLPMAMP